MEQKYRSQENCVYSRMSFLDAMSTHCHLLSLSLSLSVSLSLSLSLSHALELSLIKPLPLKIIEVRFSENIIFSVSLASFFCLLNIKNSPPLSFCPQSSASIIFINQKTCKTISQSFSLVPDLYLQ